MSLAARQLIDIREKKVEGQSDGFHYQGMGAIIHVIKQYKNQVN